MSERAFVSERAVASEHEAGMMAPPLEVNITLAEHPVWFPALTLQLTIIFHNPSSKELQLPLMTSVTSPRCAQGVQV